MATVLLDLVEQHAEEAAFLWHLRDPAVGRPRHAPRHFVRLEERLEAHLDGLRTAGTPGLELARGRLDRLVEDPEPAVHARALRLAGEVGRRTLRPALLAALADTDPTRCSWAAWSAVRLGERGAALEVLARSAEVAEPHGWPALDLAVRATAPAKAADWIRALNGDRRHARRVIRATGAPGDPAVVFSLVARMDEPVLARLAGEAFALLTGIDLAFEDLDRPPSVEPPAGPTDDPEDETLALDPDEHLPWPDPAKVEARWAQDAHRFARGTRHLLNRPVDA